jgi:hypothetical protein
MPANSFSFSAAFEALGIVAAEFARFIAITLLLLPIDLVFDIRRHIESLVFVGVWGNARLSGGWWIFLHADASFKFWERPATRRVAAIRDCDAGYVPRLMVRE